MDREHCEIPVEVLRMANLYPRMIAKQSCVQKACGCISKIEIQVCTDILKQLQHSADILLLNIVIAAFPTSVHIF